MDSLFSESEASLQALSNALRQATPSVDERLLALESVTTRAEQIAKELEERLPTLLDDNVELLRELDQLVNESKRRTDSGKYALFALEEVSAQLSSSEQDTTLRMQTIISKLSSSLKDFNQVLIDINEMQYEKIAEDTKRDMKTIISKLSSSFKDFNQVLIAMTQIQYQQNKQMIEIYVTVRQLVDELESQFDAYRVVFNRAVEKRLQKNRQKKPSASALAQEARFLAEAQARRDLLNQQRQHQLNQSRIVFFVALIFLSSGVLLVFAGIIGAYFFNITAGVITTISGTVVDVVSAIVFRFNKQENDRLDGISRELSILDRVTMAMQYISQISDGEKKDQAILDLTKQLYTVQNQQ